MSLILENGQTFEPLAEYEVRCKEHGFVTTWGQLDPSQQLAVEEGLDITGSKCILDSTS